jgi:hypothetical protein
MTDLPNHDSHGPPFLEQLGALCSLLIHDLANHLCIISGSATFAEMVLDEPERVAHSLKAIVKAGEKAGHVLSSCGELRRSLPETVPASEIHAVLAQLKKLIASKPGWELEGEAGLDGTVRLPAIWVSFAVESVMKEARMAGGTIRVRQARQASEPCEDVSPTKTAPSAPNILQVAVIYSSDQAFPLKEIRARFDHLGLLAAFELNRCLGGRIECRTLAPGQQEVCIESPLVQNIS